MLTLQKPKAGKATQRWTPIQHGWIGVDIGYRETKVAQIIKKGRNQRLLAKWRFPIPAVGDAPLWQDFEQTVSLVAEEVIRLRSMFSGRRIALSLPFDQTSLRLLDVPRSNDAEMRCMIREELAGEFNEDEICFDYWDTAAADRSEEAIAQVAVVVVPAQRSQWAAQRFATNGFDCRNLDTSLCGLARATSMIAQEQEDAFALPSDSAEKWDLVIDLGWTSTRLLFVRQGEPGFCRVIPDAGCQMFARSLQDRFRLSESQAMLLLKKVGVGAPGKGSLIGPAAKIHSCLAPILLHLITEIRRTLQFTKRQLLHQDPQSMWLFGGGADIRYLGKHFSDHFKLPAKAWELSDRQRAGQAPDNAAFAGAIALSLLAWEHDPCR